MKVFWIRVLTRLPSKKHLRWQQTRKLLAYREFTHTILHVSCLILRVIHPPFWIGIPDSPNVVFYIAIHAISRSPFSILETGNMYSVKRSQNYFRSETNISFDDNRLCCHLPACNLNFPTLLPFSSWKLTATVSIHALSVLRGSSTYPLYICSR